MIVKDFVSVLDSVRESNRPTHDISPLRSFSLLQGDVLVGLWISDCRHGQ